MIKTTEDSPAGEARRPLWRRVLSLFPTPTECRAHGPAFGFALLSGLILRLAYQPLHWSAVTLAMLLPLFWGIRRCPPKIVFWAGWLFGTVYGLWGVGWITAVARFNPLVYLGVLPAAIWWGLHMAVAVAVIVHLARRLEPWSGLFAGMMAWWAMEYFRSVGRVALPIGFLGHGMAGWPQVAQLASVAGVPLISALIVGINLSLMETVAAIRAKYGHAGAFARLGVMLGLLVVAHLWGAKVIHQTRQAYAEGDGFDVRVMLVQTGIDQSIKYNSYANPDATVRAELQQQMLTALMEQLSTIEPGQTDLVVTPESSLTQDFVDVEETVQKRLFGGALLADLLVWVKEIGVPLIVGGVDNVFIDERGLRTESLVEGLDEFGTIRAGHDVYGALWLLTPEDEVFSPVATYRKAWLMPFGEEVPYLDIIPGFQEHIVQVGTFAKAPMAYPTGMWVRRGPDEEPDELRLGFSICFEDLVPKLHRHYARTGTQLFVNTTNDAWFDGSSGPAWHFDMARWRSIETRIPMVRATNSGVTALVGPNGEVLESLPLLERATMTPTVRVLREPLRTPYLRYGDAFGLMALVGTLGLLLVLWRNEKRASR